MKKALIACSLLLLAYVVLGELVWRSDFFAALDQARRGRPLLALAEGCFFALRLLLVLAGPSLAAALAVYALWSRLTKS